jgi:hypothetical protein
VRRGMRASTGGGGGTVPNAALACVFMQVFYVASAPRNSLEVVMGKQKSTLVLSRGDTFFVPAKNPYSLRNRSTTGPIKLFFNLCRK